MPHLDRQLVLDTESKVRLPDLAKGTWGEPQFAAGDVGFGLELSAVRWPFRTYVMDAKFVCPDVNNMALSCILRLTRCRDDDDKCSIPIIRSPKHYQI